MPTTVYLKLDGLDGASSLTGAVLEEGGSLTDGSRSLLNYLTEFSDEGDSFDLKLLTVDPIPEGVITPKTVSLELLKIEGFFDSPEDVEAIEQVLIDFKDVFLDYGGLPTGIRCSSSAASTWP